MAVLKCIVPVRCTSSVGRSKVVVFLNVSYVEFKYYSDGMQTRDHIEQHSKL